jgi:flagellar motor switch protein FliM
MGQPDREVSVAVEQLADDVLRRRGGAGIDGVPMELYDFRRPERFDGQAVRSLDAAHELFTRRVSSGLGAMLRTVVQVEPLTVDQISYDDYLRAMPSPTLVVSVGLAPLPSPVLLEINLELALALLDRLLGGGMSGGGDDHPAVRRPTDLEAALLTDLVAVVLPAFEETLSSFLPVTAEVLGVEYNPQLVQIASPSESVLLFTFGMKVSQGMAAEGLLTVCYPAGAVAPLLEHVSSQLHAANVPDSVDERWTAALTESLSDVDVELRVTLDDSPVPARDLAALQVGDVLRLDHRIDRPVRGRVGDLDILLGHPGRRGRRLAVHVTELTVNPAELSYRSDA